MQKIINFGDAAKENLKEQNPDCSEIPDLPHRIFKTGGSGLRKTNSLFNLISQQPDIDKTYFYAKDPYETKNQLLINGRKGTGLKHFNDSKAFIEYSNDMNDIYFDVNTTQLKERKILIVFDDIIADMHSNKKLNPVVTELFIKGRKLNISLAFITHSYFAVLKHIKLISKHYFIMKIPNK